MQVGRLEGKAAARAVATADTLTDSACNQSGPLSSSIPLCPAHLLWEGCPGGSAQLRRLAASPASAQVAPHWWRMRQSRRG